MPDRIAHRRTAALVAAWLAGTVLVVVVGIQAVAVVSDSVTEARPAPLSAAAVNQALADQRGDTPDPTAPTTATTATTSAPTGTTRPTGRTTPTTVTTRRPPGAGPATTTTTTTRPTGTPGPTVTTASTAPSGPAPGPAEDRTYDLTGGSVGVRFENGTARLLWATPAAGFRAENHGGGGDVDIRFRSDSHESRLRAFWHDGPQAEIEENPR